MRILITGAAGMIGRRLALRLLEAGQLNGQGIDHLDLFDIAEVPVPEPAGTGITWHIGDMADARMAQQITAGRPDVVFHLASVVSGQAEREFDLGYRVNLSGGHALLQALRGNANRPRLVFASSGSVFGGPLPDILPDTYAPCPQTSYGTQKLMVEGLVQDFSRKGFIDGVSIRLPAICIRPGAPNKAASGFYSGIIREPLNGVEAVVPVSRDRVHTSASPRAAVDYLLHAAQISSDRIGPVRSLNMPGVCCSVGEQIDAMARVAGTRFLRFLRDEPDAEIESIVGGWPKGYDPRRAVDLGFRGEADFDEIIRIYIEEELPDGPKG